MSRLPCSKYGVIRIKEHLIILYSRRRKPAVRSRIPRLVPAAIKEIKASENGLGL